MTMFNDIVWNANDENCVSNAEKVKNYSKRFSAGHWTLLGPGSKEKWYGNTNHDRKGQWNCTAEKMVQQFKETGHLVFKGISALSRGVLKQKKGRTFIHFNGDSMNTELLFQTVHSVHQLSVYGAVANWCHQSGSTEDENGRTIATVDNKILTKLKPEEVQLLVSHPKKASGNRMPERVQSFEELTGQVHLTHLCEKAFFQYRIAAGKNAQNSTKCGRRMVNNCPFVPRILEAGIPEGTITGSILESHIVKIVDEYGIEVSIPSFAYPMNTSYVRSRAFCE